MNIKKKITAAFIFVSLCIMTLGAVSVSAEITENGLHYKISNGEIAITGYSGSEETVTIPSSIDGIPVTSIDLMAFYKKEFKKVIIEDGLKTISSNAFCECAKLESVVIPNSVTSIKDRAFDQCTALTDVTLPNQIKAIEEYTFYKCSSLKSIVIPDGVKSIDKFVFRGCSSLESIKIPNSVESIGNNAFYGCSSLKSIVIPNSVESIGEYAFDSCSNLKSIIIPESVTTLGKYAFWNCSSLETVVLSDNLTSIEEGTLCRCSDLKSIIIPDGVTSIGRFAFYNCSDLKNIVIPKSVTSIADNAFADCSVSMTVNYTGSKDDKEKINIGENNGIWVGDSNKNYNYSGALTETLSADSTESSITTTSQAFLINSPEEVKAFGTIFIPLKLFEADADIQTLNIATVSYTNSNYNIKDRQKYEATLTDIPEECKDWGIVAISFIQSGDEVSYSNAKYMSVNNTTLESATTAEE